TLASWSSALAREARSTAPLAEQALIAPVCDEARLVICLGALAHLAHLLRKRCRPREVSGEIARRAALEEKAVSPGFHELGKLAHAARDHRQRVRERLDHRPRRALAGEARHHEVSGARHAFLHLGKADLTEQTQLRVRRQLSAFGPQANDIDACTREKVERLEQDADAVLMRKPPDEEPGAPIHSLRFPASSAACGTRCAARALAARRSSRAPPGRGAQPRARAF